MNEAQNLDWLKTDEYALLIESSYHSGKSYKVIKTANIKKLRKYYQVDGYSCKFNATGDKIESLYDDSGLRNNSYVIKKLDENGYQKVKTYREFLRVKRVAEEFMAVVNSKDFYCQVESFLNNLDEKSADDFFELSLKLDETLLAFKNFNK